MGTTTGTTLLFKDTFYRVQRFCEFMTFYLLISILERIKRKIWNNYFNYQSLAVLKLQYHYQIVQ